MDFEARNSTSILAQMATEKMFARISSIWTP